MVFLEFAPATCGSVSSANSGQEIASNRHDRVGLFLSS